MYTLSSDIECGETGRENITYYLSSSTTTSTTTSSPASTLSRPTVCEYTVCPASDNICRLRLDFNTFKIASPNTAVRAPPTAPPSSGPSVVLDAAPKIGVCERDSFTGWKNFLSLKHVLFWAQVALAALVAILGPKKSRFQGPPLIMALVMDSARLKIIAYRAIKATGTMVHK